jgi:hypothetical protein
MEALVEDIEQKPMAPAAVVSNPSEPQADVTPGEEGSKPDAPKSNETNLEDITRDLKKKFNIDQMTQEKEAEI